MTVREGYQPGGICNFVPDREVLDEYNDRVLSTMVFDSNGRTLRGQDPFVYMHAGIKEELHELWQSDTLNGDYSRLGMLLGAGTQIKSLGVAGTVTEQAAELHQKEFGDVSWYMSYRLRSHDISMSDTIDPAIELRTVDALNMPGCCPELLDHMENMFPGAMLLGYGQAFEQASYEALDDHSIKNLDRLSATAGRLILSMNQFLHVAFDSSYEAVLEQNIAKLLRRKAAGTIHDLSGGDTR